MKKFNLLIALGMLVVAMSLSPTTAKAQDEKQQEMERNFYDACYTKKDATCLPLAKELKEKYPTSKYVEFVDKLFKKDLSDKFQAALTAFYAGPDGPKLDQLVKAAEDYLVVEKTPSAVAYVVTRVALATTYGSMAGMYKDTEKAKSYAQRSLQLMASDKAPEGWDAKDYLPLRETALAQLNQFLGYQILQNNGDPVQAVGYLNKAIAVKQKDGLGWKDPNNYFLRANASFSEYSKLSKEYQALPDEKKTAEEGKAALAKLNPTVDRMIADYARVVVTANKPETKQLKDQAKEQLDTFWKFRTDKPDALPGYLKLFEADPTIPDPPVPAKAETADATAAAGVPPTGSVGEPKLTTAVTPTGAGGAAAGNGKSAAPVKGKAPAKSKKGRPK